jgi:hypothetical protein
MPQVPPVLQEPALLVLLKESEPPPDTLEANIETFFITSWLLQIGQVTSSVVMELRTSSSKFCPQSLQMNSNSGIYFPSHLKFQR